MDLIMYSLEFLKMVCNSCGLELYNILYCMVEGLPLDKQGRCRALKCLSQHPDNYNWTDCTNGDIMQSWLFLQDWFQDTCSFKTCILGLPFPFLPKIIDVTVCSHYINPLDGNVFLYCLTNHTDIICIYSINTIKTNSP